MRHTFNLFVLCLICLFLKCKTDSEVYGTYNLIDGLKNSYLLPLSSTAQPPTASTAPTAQTGDQPSEGTEQSTAKFENEEQSKQVSAPNIETTTVSPISAYQTAYNRLQNIGYNPAMARKIGLSTLMMSSVLYGLTMIPALIAITGASPLAGIFGGFGRRKRSLVNESHIYRQLPLLTNEETFKFLKLFESTLAARKIESPQCKKYYTCKVFYSVLKSGENPKLSVFENAIVNVFGIAVERKDYKIQFIPTVKLYYNVAKDAIKGESCARRYPCSLQAHHLNHQNKPGLWP